MKSLLGVLCILAGCGTRLVDPCANEPGTCLAVQIESATVSQVDALSLHVFGSGVDATRPATRPSGVTDLPVAVGIVFDSFTSGSLAVTVDATGVLRGMVVGEGSAPGTVTAGRHTTVHVSLGEGPPLDGGLVDGSTDFATTDLSSINDLNQSPSDLAALVFHASHVASSYYIPNAASLFSVTSIDTKMLTINGAGPPANIQFVHDANGLAVLSVGGWTVDQDVTVTGDTGLVVVAAGAVDIKAVIHASANLAVPGPGGFLGGSAGSAGLGPGGGGTAGNTGGTPGGGGGNFGGGASASEGAAGAIYGALLTDFNGGSGGGVGYFATQGGCSGITAGAGGGAIQISAASSVIVEAAGGINVGGGGGSRGCVDMPGSLYSTSGAGGGGSGGEIFLEAPSIQVFGVLAANGGGGGGPPPANGVGLNGSNATLGAAAAPGGISGGGNGGAGATGTTSATTPSPATVGGGGGGVGRIWLRTRQNAANTTGAVISPSASTDLTL